MWDDEFQVLLTAGVLTGYALITQEKKVIAYGALTELSDEHGDLAAGGRHCWAVFNAWAGAGVAGGAPLPKEQCINLSGQRAVVCSREDGFLLAVSHGKRLGLLLHHLPAGVLVCSFGKPHSAQEVAPKVERVVHSLRR